MSIPVSEILGKASIVLNDTAFVRWTKAELIGWLNDAASEVVLRRPPAHAVTENVALVAGILQRIPAGGIELMDIARNVGGNAVRRTDRQLLDDQKPDWPVMRQSSSIKHYTFDERTPTVFYVYPPAKIGAQVEMLYSAPPALVATDADTLDLDRAYLSPLVSFMLYRALAKDSEYANGQVAAAHFQAFSEALGSQNQTSLAVSPNAVSV